MMHRSYQETLSMRHINDEVLVMGLGDFKVYFNFKPLFYLILK